MTMISRLKETAQPERQTNKSQVKRSNYALLPPLLLVLCEFSRAELGLPPLPSSCGMTSSNHASQMPRTHSRSSSWPLSPARFRLYSWKSSRFGRLPLFQPSLTFTKNQHYQHEIELKWDITLKGVNVPGFRTF